MDIGDAISHLRQGRAVSRPSWNGIKAGETMWIALQAAEPLRRRLGYVVMWTASGDLIPWLASQSDLLADDWIVVMPGDTKLPPLADYPLTGPLPGDGKFVPYPQLGAEDRAAIDAASHITGRDIGRDPPVARFPPVGRATDPTGRSIGRVPVRDPAAAPIAAAEYPPSDEELYGHHITLD